MKTRIKSFISNLYLSVLNYFKNKIYEYEFSILNKKICSPLYDVYVSDTHVSILTPILSVTKVLENYFGFDKYIKLNIHGINVDTQKEIVEITFHILRPGSFIGAKGVHIDEIEKRLMELFNKRVKIKIVEIRKDINEPQVFY